MNNTLQRGQILDRYATHINAARVGLLKALQIDLVVDRSEGYRVWDMDGREFLDLDLRAGVYNLGHRNPNIIAALKDALKNDDMGFALFPGANQSLLAEQLGKSSGLSHTLFAASGTEANDMAIQVARRITGRRRILSCSSGYHGATGLSSAAGNPEFSMRFNSDYPKEFVTFGVDEVETLELALKGEDIAAVVLEPSCNAAGYPSVRPTFWSDVRRLCDENGSLLIIDEIVTGLGRSGVPWGFQNVGANPDIAVTAKGLSGGVYPIAAVMLSDRSAAWLTQDFAGFAGTFAGGELACAVGIAALELSTSESTLARVNQNMQCFGRALHKLCSRRSWIAGVRQFGLLFGLELEGEDSGIRMIKHLFDQGVLTFPAANAGNVVNLKLGHLVDDEFCDGLLERMDGAFESFGRTI
ncbi:MAG: aspartate aminotransferase family protein [Pseudomonadota bacterium]